MAYVRASKCAVAAEPMPRPQATFDQTISCTKYETKPANDPTMAIPLLATTDPVKRKPISIIEKNPATCQVTDLVKSLIVLSIGCFSAKCFELLLEYRGYGCVDIM